MKPPAPIRIAPHRSAHKLKSAIKPIGQTRRTFLKRSGSGILATAVGLGVLTDEAYGAISVSGGVTLNGDGELEIGLDEDGYREEMIEAILPASNTPGPAVDWKYNPPNKPMTLPHDPAPNESTAPPNRITIYCSPADGAYSLVGNKVHANFLAPENGVRPVEITALSESIPVQPNRTRNRQECYIKIVKDGVENRIPIFVLVPKYFIKTPNPIVDKTVMGGPVTFHREYVDSPVMIDGYQHTPSALEDSFETMKNPGGTLVRTPGYGEKVTVKVTDQFDSFLPAFYDGTAVREVKPLPPNPDGTPRLMPDGTQRKGRMWVDWIGGSKYQDPVFAFPWAYLPNTNPPKADVTIDPGPGEEDGSTTTINHTKPLPWSGAEFDNSFEVQIAGHTMVNGISRTLLYTDQTSPAPSGDPVDRAKMKLTWN